MLLVRRQSDIPRPASSRMIFAFWTSISSMRCGCASRPLFTNQSFPLLCRHASNRGSHRTGHRTARRILPPSSGCHPAEPLTAYKAHLSLSMSVLLVLVSAKFLLTAAILSVPRWHCLLTELWNPNESGLNNPSSHGHLRSALPEISVSPHSSPGANQPWTYHSSSAPPATPFSFPRTVSSNSNNSLSTSVSVSSRFKMSLKNVFLRSCHQLRSLKSPLCCVFNVLDGLLQLPVVS